MAGEQEQTEPEREPESGATGASGLVGRSIEEFVHQLRGFTDRARAVAGSVPGRLSAARAAQPARARCRPPS